MRPVMVLLPLAYPLAVHILVLSGHEDLLAFAVAGLALIHIAFAWRAARLLDGSLAVGLLSLGIFDVVTGGKIAHFLPPVLVTGSLLIVFGRTLLPGREPLVTYFARVLMNENGAATRNYTRRVTAIWAFVFAMLLVETIALGALASLEVWSLFVNVLNYLLVGALLLLELLFRTLVMRRHSLKDFFLALRHADFPALFKDAGR